MNLSPKVSPKLALRGTGAAPSRRAIVGGLGLALGAATAAFARPEPPSTVTDPPRDFSPGGAPTPYFSDPDVLTVDPAFEAYVVPNSAIRRIWTGALWVEGPAWNSLGRIRLPEVCANLTFGGPKRNRLFMAASQSIYALTVNTQGAGPA